MKIKGVEEIDIEKGYMLCNTDNFCQITNEFMAEVSIMELPDHKSILSEGYLCVLHLHTYVLEVEISAVEAVIHADKKKTKSNFLKSNQKGIVKILVIFLKLKT